MTEPFGRKPRFFRVDRSLVSAVQPVAHELPSSHGTCLVEEFSRGRKSTVLCLSCWQMSWCCRGEYKLCWWSIILMVVCVQWCDLRFVGYYLQLDREIPCVGKMQMTVPKSVLIGIALVHCHLWIALAQDALKGKSVFSLP